MFNARLCTLVATIACLASNVSSATIYISNPTSTGGPAVPGPQTYLFSIEEDGTGFTELGLVTSGGSQASISAIATDAFGTLYGFVYDAAGSTSTLMTIDPITLEATPVGAGTPIAASATGAAFDRDGRLWIYDRLSQGIQEIDVATLTAVGLPFSIPDPVSTDGGDLAFDLDGNCYFQGTVVGNASTPFYACDLDDGSMTEIGSWTRVGPWADPGLSLSGIGFSLDLETCEPILLGSDGYGIDEIAELRVDTMEAVHVANTGTNISWYTQVDVASFASVALVPACDSCGDGVIDAAEECDDGNLLDGDGCNSVCLVEPNDGCVDDPKDWAHTPLDAWPVSELEYFGGPWYDYAIVGFLGWNSADASVILMKEVIAFDLNVAAATEAGALADTRDAAIALLEVINVGEDPQGEVADEALALAAELAAYNDGLAGPAACEDDV